jgi:two-component system sensor histidine kinase CpxA
VFFARTDSTPQYWFAARVPVRPADSPRIIPGTLLIAGSTFFSHPLFFRPGRWILIALVAIGLSVLCWAPFLRGLTRSIKQMEHATAQIAEGRFNVPVDASRPDEVGRLGASINRMASRLQATVTGQKRFLGDTAHELRSPLARLQVALEILQNKPSGREEPLINDIREDVQAMTRLTDDLLQYARAELSAQPVRLSEVDVRGAVDRAMRQEARSGIDTIVDVPAGLTVIANEELLVRALANVLRNSIRYAGDAGSILVAGQGRDGAVTITITDSGPGVPPEMLDRIFTPFARLESSRDRRSGGVGLGLAIVRSAVEACGGSVTCSNGTPSGLEVSLSLPAARSDAGGVRLQPDP